MKILLLFFLTTLFSINVIGQTTEFSFHLTSGLFAFRGQDSKNSTIYNVTDINKLTGYTNSPYGRESGFSYGFAINAERVTKSNFIFGFQTGYESLSSMINIKSAGNGLSIWEAYDSKTILKHQFLNFQLFFGKRFSLFKNIESDLTLGLDMGICLEAREFPNIKTSEGTFSTSHERNKPEGNDYRLRFDIINYYKNFGLTIGYSHGLKNYMKDWVGGPIPEVYSRMLRFGLVYKI